MNPESSSHESNHSPSLQVKRPGAFSIFGMVVLFLALVAAMFVIGHTPRKKDAAEAKHDAEERSSNVPRVSVAPPKETPGESEVTLNCDVKANKATTILARTNGYLKALHAEINDVVKEGQLLAEIDTPEVDAELLRSRASLLQAQASLAKSETALDLAERLLKRDKTITSGAITAEELDNRTASRDTAANARSQAQADVKYAEAEVKRLEVLQSFERITAPYDGRITFRFLDVGALISPGDNSNAELFTIAEINTARVIIHVPQSYATDIDLKSKPVLTVRNYPGRQFVGKIAGSSGQFDPASRTMLFLLFFPNADSALYPGMYGQVKLGLSSAKPVLQIPTSAVLAGGEGPKVMIVKDGIAALRPITLGRDFGTDIEVLTGISKKDMIATSPPVQVTDGAHVIPLLREENRADTHTKVGAR
jgi:RND family efflux transporter MFP subunit